MRGHVCRTSGGEGKVNVVNVLGLAAAVIGICWGIWAWLNPKVACRLGSFRISVTDERGTPVAGARVVGPDYRVVCTGEDGVAVAPPAWARHDVIVVSSGRAPLGPVPLVLEREGEPSSIVVPDD